MAERGASEFERIQHDPAGEGQFPGLYLRGENAAIR